LSSLSISTYYKGEMLPCYRVIPPIFHGTWQEKSEKVLVNSF
jgi:hypothetical protein